MEMLIAKLVQIKEEEHREKIEDIQGSYKQIAWGSQIRSYVFQPYTLVKDHRTGEETGNCLLYTSRWRRSFIHKCCPWQTLKNVICQGHASQFRPWQG